MSTADEAWVDAVHPISGETFFSNLVTGKTQTSRPLSFVRSDDIKFLSESERALRLSMNAFYTNLPAAPKRNETALALARLLHGSLGSPIVDLSGAKLGALGAQCVAWALLEQAKARGGASPDGSRGSGSVHESRAAQNHETTKPAPAARAGGDPRDAWREDDWIERLAALGMQARSTAAPGRLILGGCSLFAREAADVNRLRLLFFAMMQHRSLSAVDLRYNALGPLGGALAGRLLAGNRTLHSLVLRGCGLGDEGAEALAAGLGPTAQAGGAQAGGAQAGGAQAGGAGTPLAGAGAVCCRVVNLDVSECGIGDGGMVALARALALNASVLRLDVGRNVFGPAGARALGVALRLNDTVETILLDGNDLTGSLRLPNMRDYSGVQALFHGRAARSLRGVSMDGTALGNDGVHRVAPLLQGHPSLETISVRACSLGRGGLEALAEVLRQSPRLREIRVGQNEGLEGLVGPRGVPDRRLVF
jgi:hypothetical protein